MLKVCVCSCYDSTFIPTTAWFVWLILIIVPLTVDGCISLLKSWASQGSCALDLLAGEVLAKKLIQLSRSDSSSSDGCPRHLLDGNQKVIHPYNSRVHCLSLWTLQEVSCTSCFCWCVSCGTYTHHGQPKLWGDYDMHASHNLIYYAEKDFERNLALGLIWKDLWPFELSDFIPRWQPKFPTSSSFITELERERERVLSKMSWNCYSEKKTHTQKQGMQV